MANELTRVFFALLTLLQCITLVRVSGQTVTIEFENVGEYDYNGGKAFLEGTTVHLLCEIKNGPVQQDHAVVFLKDGQKFTSGFSILEPNEPLHYFVQHNKISDTNELFKLFIYDVSKLDQGFYTCEIQDQFEATVVVGQYSNTPAARPDIVVLYLPDENKYPDCSVVEGVIRDVKIGAKINLRCTSEFGEPEVELTWKKTASGSTTDLVGSVSESDGEVNNSVDPITITAENDGDIYTCFMKPSTTYFPMGLRTCDIGPLNVVSDVPLPVITPQTQNVDPGNNVLFQCELPGNADAKFTWTWYPNWVFDKDPTNPDDTGTFALSNVRSYHNLTKVYCITVSEDTLVSVYGLVRVSGPYEEPPMTPAPPVTLPGGDGSGGTGTGGDGSGTGGTVTGGTGTGGTGGTGGSNGEGGAKSTPASGNGEGMRTGGQGITRQTVNIVSILMCLCLGILYFV